MKLKLYMSNLQEVGKRNKFNKDFEEALKLIPEIKKHGHEVELIDTSNWTEGESIKIYTEELVSLAQGKPKIKINTAFGRNGFLIGKATPLLKVLDDNNETIDIYPREKARKRTTIREYFESLLIKGNIEGKTIEETEKGLLTEDKGLNSKKEEKLKTKT